MQKTINRGVEGSEDQSFSQLRKQSSLRCGYSSHRSSRDGHCYRRSVLYTI